MARRFKRKGDGLIVSMPAGEVEILRSIPGQLEELLAGPRDPDDPVFKRLFPTAYLDPTQEEAEREWQELVHPELLRERLAALELVTGTLDRGVEKRGNVEVALSEDDVAAWLGVLNDARLALGTRLGVTEDLDEREVDPDAPDATGHALYTWLTWIEGELVETLLG
jgi:Domain of unknown function (DUF2017)